MTLRLLSTAGAGVLGRHGDLVVLCSTPHGSEDVVDAVVAAHEQVAQGGGDGSALADRIAAVARGVDYVAFAPTPQGLAISVVGHAWAVVATEYGEQRLALPAGHEGVRSVLPGGVRSIRAGLGDVDTAAPVLRWNDLGEGTARAGSLMLAVADDLEIPTTTAVPPAAGAQDPAPAAAPPAPEPPAPEPPVAAQQDAPSAYGYGTSAPSGYGAHPGPTPPPTQVPPTPVPPTPGAQPAHAAPTPGPGLPAAPASESALPPPPPHSLLPEPSEPVQAAPPPPDLDPDPPAFVPAPAADAPPPVEVPIEAAAVQPAASAAEPAPAPSPRPPAAEAAPHAQPAPGPAPSPQPPAPEAAPQAEPGPTGPPQMASVAVPNVAVDRSQPFASIALFAPETFTPDEPRAPLPVVTRPEEPPIADAPIPANPVADDAVEIVGVYCKNGHFDDPSARYCAICGISMAQQTLIPRRGPRPPLGVLVLDDGSIFTLDSDYVIGRDPSRDPDVLSGAARPLRIDDPEGLLSRVHARIHLDGWSVQVVDLGSANGTGIWGPNDTIWQRAPVNSAQTVRPGTQVGVGRRQMRYESHRNT